MRNYIDENNIADNTIGLWEDFFDIGNPNQHFQTLQINYELPFIKIPVLRFVKATYSYTGDFQWQRGSLINQFLEGIPDLGNAVQNASIHQLNAGLEMQELYKYLGLNLRKSTPVTVQQRSAAVPTLQRNPGAKPAEQRLSAGDRAYNRMIGFATALKRFQVTYRENHGIFLPGYTESIGFLGTIQPTLGFTLGLQEDVRQLAARRGWLTLYQEFNQQYSAVKNQQLDAQASLSFIPDLTIDLSANRIYSRTYSESYRVSPVELEYHSLTPYNFGNFNISTILIATSFNRNDAAFSETFEIFRENRLEVARRLASENGRDPNDTDAEGYPIGFGRSSQAVLLPAFVAAYTGVDASSIKLGAFSIGIIGISSIF